MRLILGLILTGGFSIGGLMILGQAVLMLPQMGAADDVLAAFFIGGMLTFIGILMGYATIKTRNRKREIDAAQLSAMGMAHMMNMDFEDGGGYGD